MLLPSSMRINDPFSMKLEKVETPPAPAVSVKRFRPFTRRASLWE